MGTGCYVCVGEAKMALDAMTKEERASDAGETMSKIREADTWVPQWQQKNIPGMGMVLGVCTIPICIDHIATKPKTAEEMAIEGGQLLPGSLGG